MDYSIRFRVSGNLYEESFSSLPEFMFFLFHIQFPLVSASLKGGKEFIGDELRQMKVVAQKRLKVIQSGVDVSISASIITNKVKAYQKREQEEERLLRKFSNSLFTEIFA